MNAPESNTFRLGGDPLYASVAGRMAVLSNEEVVFFDPEAGRSHVMTTQVIEALDRCRAFLPMDEHVKAVANGVAGLAGQETAVRRVLEGLASRGLMISDDAFLQRLRSTAATTQAPVHGLFVRACDRPAQLHSLLASRDAMEEGHAALNRWVVVDDSRVPASVEQHEKSLREAAEHGLEVCHVSPARWQDFVDGLSNDLPEHADALRSLLRHDSGYRGPRGGGQGRNLITLLSAGGRHLLLDDDNLFPLARHPDAAGALRPENLSWAVRTYAAQEAALAVGEPDREAVAAQLSMCGRTLGELIAAGKVRLDRQDLAGRMPSAEPLLRGDLRVAMTVNGHRGASCASGVNWLLLLDPAARSAMLASEADYRRLRGDPAVWFGCSAFAATRLAQFTPFALDNSMLMPCTSPYGRSEDAVFNALTSALHGDGVQLHVPYSVGHDPGAPRDRSALYAEPDTPDLNQCLADLIIRVADELHAATPEARLAAVAARIEDLAAGSEHGLVSYMAEFLAYRRATLIARLQQVIAASQDVPDWYYADLRSQVEANGRAVIERRPPRFAGWPEQSSAAELATRFRTQSLTLARGLRAWPALREAAMLRAPGFLSACRL